jgi:agmatinase
MTISHLASKLLAPAGDGVFTVSNAQDRKASLQKKLYGTKDVKASWLKTIDELSHNDVAVFGIPSDCGGGILRGANWGPLFVREALLKDGPHSMKDLGDVRVIPHLLQDELLNTKTIETCRMALYQQSDVEYPVAPLNMAEYFLDHLYKEKNSIRVLGLGGDHSVSYPLVRSWAKNRMNKKIALLHFDAHTDLLSSRLGIPLTFGSWTYHVRDFFPTPDQLIQVGIRSTKKDRQTWERDLNITQLWAQEVKDLGPKSISDQIVSAYKRAKVEEVYISFDIDALDSKWASATGTPELDGLDPYVCGEIIRSVAKHFKITGADLVEVAPFVNHDFFPNNSQESTLMTAASMTRILARALGADA